MARRPSCLCRPAALSPLLEAADPALVVEEGHLPEPVVAGDQLAELGEPSIHALTDRGNPFGHQAGLAALVLEEHLDVPAGLFEATVHFGASLVEAGAHLGSARALVAASAPLAPGGRLAAAAAHPAPGGTSSNRAFISARVGTSSKRAFISARVGTSSKRAFISALVVTSSKRAFTSA